MSNIEKSDGTRVGGQIRPDMSKTRNKKRLAEERNIAPELEKEIAGYKPKQDPLERIAEQNQVIIDHLNNMVNSLNALVYYSTKTRGVAADIEKDIGSAFVTEGNAPVGPSGEEEGLDPAAQALYDVEKEQDPKRFAESTMQGGKEQFYPSVDATDRRVQQDALLDTEERVKESAMSDEDLKDLIREQLFIIRKNKNG